jgi:hypothetical protein
MNWEHCGIDKRERISGRELIVVRQVRECHATTANHNVNRASVENTDLAE